MIRRLYATALAETEKLATFAIQVPRRALLAAEAAVKALIAEDL